MATEVETSSLDDFFAKKDKSKKKKTKVLSEVNALSQSEEKPKKKKSKEKSSATLSEGGKIASASSSSTDNNKADVEPEAPNDEWVEIEEKADADYTGLKIQSLRLEEREAAAAKEEEEEEEAAKNGGAVNDGPWKKVEAAPVIEKETTEVVSESKESTPTGSGKYVPPSVRAAQRQAAQQPSAPLRKRNNKLAPDVTDQESFPTLGGGGGGGGRRTPGPGDAPADAPKSYTSLHLQNKWDSLSRGSSEP